jgi:hypothetical protein
MCSAAGRAGLPRSTLPAILSRLCGRLGRRQRRSRLLGLLPPSWIESDAVAKAMIANWS